MGWSIDLVERDGNLKLIVQRRTIEEGESSDNWKDLLVLDEGKLINKIKLKDLVNLYTKGVKMADEMNGSNLNMSDEAEELVKKFVDEDTREMISKVFGCGDC